ncbi:MAG: hypothetical protein WD669_07425 [Pirellulales bacterium]
MRAHLPARPRVLPLACLPLAGLALCPAPPAKATMQFQQVFIDQYLADHPDRDYVEFIRSQAKCYTCHQGCEDRRNHNAYGQVLADRLDALADRDDVSKVLAALREVENLPADPKTPDGPTFAERIAASLLPAGDLEDAKREPAIESASTPNSAK